MEYSLSHTATMIQAATIVHNICIDDNDIGEVNWDIYAPVYKKPACNTHTSDDNAAREALTLFFNGFFVMFCCYGIIFINS